MVSGIRKILHERRFGTFGPAAGGTIVLLIGWADRTDFFAGVLGGDSGLARMIHWLAENPVWLTVTLILWAVGYPAYFWRQYANGLHAVFNDEWKKTVVPRQELRDLIHFAHARWTGSPSSFATVARLIEKAGFPNGLPFKKGRLRDYAARAEEMWVGDRKQLLSFCIEIYPVQGESPVLWALPRVRFYDARSVLSKFWDEWGRRCYDEGSIKESVLSPRLQFWELTLLTYLEIALALRNNEELPGKQGLFQLGREAARKNKR
jgi:hypothetical protein